MFCYIIYDSVPSKYTKLEGSYGRFIHGRKLKFEFEKSPLHTIIYGATGTGKTYFVRQNLKLFLEGKLSEKPDHDQDQKQVEKNKIEQGQVDKNIIEQGQVDKNIIEQFQDDKNNIEQCQEQDQGTCFADYKNIIIVYKDERDWINPETGVPYV